MEHVKNQIEDKIIKHIKNRCKDNVIIDCRMVFSVWEQASKRLGYIIKVPIMNQYNTINK